MKSILLPLAILCVVVPQICIGAEFDANSAAEIQAVFDVAVSNGEDDTIRIAAGTHTVNGSTLSFVSTEGYSLRIEGQGRGETVLDGGGQVRVMAINTTQTSIDAGATITVTGISFMNGYTEDGGGGGLSVIVDLADIVVKKCEFLGNVANPSEDAFIDSYRKNGGGGVFLAVGKMLRTGGGDVYIDQCRFSNNSTSALGGAAYIYAFGEYIISVRCENNIFINNNASLYGGGVWVETNSFTCVNNTITANQAGLSGGGIFSISGSWLNFYNNIAWGNQASEFGSDLYIDDRGFGTKHINIFSNNYSEVEYFAGNSKSEGDNSNEDPLLDDDLTPSQGSPCINTGDNDAPELACGDYNGHERTHGGTVDRGAVEYGSNDPEDPDCNSADPIDPPDTDPYPIPSVDGGSGAGGCFIGAVNVVDPESKAYKAAERIAERHRSGDVQAAIAAAKQRLRPKVKRQCRQVVQPAATHAGKMVDPKRPELLVFISSSMPAATTIGFARDAHQIKERSQVRFVLRGFPEGGLNQYLQRVRADDYTLNLFVDPLLFDAYQVERVPTVVVNRDVRVDHPRDLKAALTRTQAATGQDFQPLIRHLSW